MKKHISEFLRRGAIAAGIGPIVLAVLYLIMHSTAGLDSLTVKEVCTGIFSITALAFVAGGLNAIYQIERLPLMLAVFIHGSVLYVGYLITYLLNSWLRWDKISVLVFTCIFVVGYLAIWAVIYSVIKKNTDKINEMLKKKQQDENYTLK
jgi:membrane-bound ClpP family serine protease